jgi:type I protein arginine methyltransferase
MEGANPWAEANDFILGTKAHTKTTEDIESQPKKKSKKKKAYNQPSQAQDESKDIEMEVDLEEQKPRKTHSTVRNPYKFGRDGMKNSTEEGFKGTPDNWFNDDEFKKGLIADFTHKEGGDYYFESYSNFYIHEEMLKDKVRTQSYQRAIENNPEAFKDKIVLDIGCGTGVLSIFAARAGAKHVYGIDNADIVHYAREIVKVNGFQDQITIIKGKVEEIDLPVEKVDIIISEWMGYFLLFESMMDTVIFARDKWLVEGGLILPDTCTMHIAAIEDEQYKTNKLNFWNNVYGIDMSCLSKAAFVEPIVDSVDCESITSTNDIFFKVDLNTVKKEDLDFCSSYEIKMKRDDNIHGIVTWFNIVFSNLPHEVRFSTGPYGEYTHWKQTVFYFHGKYKVNTGDVLKGSIACRKSKDNFRACDIKISYHLHPKSADSDTADKEVLSTTAHSQIIQYKLR